MTDKKTWDTSRFEKAIRDFDEEYPVPYFDKKAVVGAPTDIRNACCTGLYQFSTASNPPD